MRRALVALGVLFLLGIAGCAVIANSFEMSGDIGPAALFGPPPIQDASYEERRELRRYGRLAYVSDGVWTMNADGSDRQRLADVPATPPLRWSPDGSRLVFS